MYLLQLLFWIRLFRGIWSIVYTGTSVTLSTDQSALVAFCGLDKMVNVRGQLLFLGDQTRTSSYTGTTEILKWDEEYKCYSVLHATSYMDCPAIDATVFRGCRDAVVYAQPHGRVQPFPEKGTLLRIVEPRVSDTGSYYIRVSLAGRNMSDIFRMVVIIRSSKSWACNHSASSFQAHKCIRYVDRMAFENYLIGHVGNLLDSDSELHAIYNITPQSISTDINIVTTPFYDNSGTIYSPTVFNLFNNNSHVDAMNSTGMWNTVLKYTLPRLIYFSTMIVLCIIALAIYLVCERCRSPHRRIYIGEPRSDEAPLITSAVNESFQYDYNVKETPSDVIEKELMEKLRKKVELLEREECV
uniref:Envelope glycoprotein I n=1 Tax=Gallid alphaherpesvirus 2 TaxID=10390 RepID=J9PHJ6_9ALPH|nr:glycoprotein I [Gallid alphaherpesvirus 2]